MMPPHELVRMILGNVGRSPRHLVLSSFGIVVGVASFVFFLGLSMGVRGVVLKKIFPLEQVRVVSKQAIVGTVDISKPIDDDVVAALRAHPNVADAVPRMSMRFPAAGYGNFEGAPLAFDVGPVADGIDSRFLADDPKLAALFRDWSDVTGPVCVPPGRGGAPPTSASLCPDPERYYCDEKEGRCLHRVPVVISPFLIEMYSSTFAKTYKLPAVSAQNASAFIELRGLKRLSFKIVLGASALIGQEGRELPAHRQRTVEGVLVGVSPKAIQIGLTLPIQYIERWNRELGDAAGSYKPSYSAVEVTLRDADELATFVQFLSDKHKLAIDSPLGEKFATAIFVIAALFTLISFAIITISAINIAHNFFMQVSERRREIGVLRAVGATQGDVRAIVLGEAAVIGLLGGVLGVGFAVAASLVVDWFSAHYLPRFPFKPTTYFDFQTWIWTMGIGFSILFCVLGGFLPARKAAQMEPATALAQP